LTAHLCLENLNSIQFDKENMTATFGPGVNFTMLMKACEKEGRVCALQNIPSLPHVSLIGSAITATHGSGYKYPVVTKNIIAIDIVHADGTLKTYD
jgi:xylitol oxidase